MWPYRGGNPRRVVGLALAGFGLSGLGIASAAQINIDSQTVVAGTATVTTCDVDGVTVVPVAAYFAGGGTPGYHLTEVVIGDLNELDSVCDGTISVVVSDVTGNALATGSIGFPAAPTTEVTVTLTSPVTASAVTGIAVAIG
jgi:hypothetical protein